MNNKTKKIINAVSYYILLATSAVFGAYMLYARFTNVHATETELLINYWREYLVFLAVILVSGFVNEATKERRKHD